MKTKNDNMTKKPIETSMDMLGIILTEKFTSEQALVTVCYKSSSKFSIMIEKCTDAGWVYKEYNSYQEEPLYSAQDIQINCKQYEDFTSFSNRITTLKSLNYTVISPLTMKAREALSFVMEAFRILRHHVFTEQPTYTIIDMVASMLRPYRKDDLKTYNSEPWYSYQDLKELNFKLCSIQTFQNYITSISMVLIQAQRQYTFPNNCIETIWFYTMNGFLDANVFHDKKIESYKISSECLAPKHASISKFFIPKSEKSKQCIEKSSDVVANNPNQ